MEYSKNAVFLKWQVFFFLTISCFLLAHPALAVKTKQDLLAEDLKRNVVSIYSEWEDDYSQNGFGFIVGEKDGKAYIATANHVVRRNDPDNETVSKITLKFHGEGFSHNAQLLEYTEPGIDLAALIVEIPEGVSWRKDAMKIGKPEEGSEVWFIGRSEKWYYQKIPGVVNQVRNVIAKLDGLNVLVGTSGAPLISTNDGIIGMMIRDQSAGVSEALIISYIQELFENWSQPWDLTEYTPDPPTRDPVAMAPRECSISGLVFDSATNRPLSSVSMALAKNERGQLKTLKPSVAITGPRGEFTINCEEFDESQFPLWIVLRHQDWYSTWSSGTKIERSGKREGFNISVKSQFVKKQASDPVAAKPSECSFSGLVFDSETNRPLSSVWMDLQEDKGKRSKKIKTLAATTGPRGKFTINCGEFDESQFPLRIALRHRDWYATSITGARIEGSGKWEGINISVNTRSLKNGMY